jgi:hypothetical protein
VEIVGITGRYNFPGIQKAAGLLVDGLVAGTGWGAWLLASPFKPVVNYLRDLLINYLANRGIILLNIGVNIVDGVIDQKKMDAALDDGIRRVMQGRDKISPADGKAIDDKVRKAFDDNADLGADNGMQ